MKKEYSILPRTAQNFWPTFCILILLGLVIVLVLPFFDWFTTQTQPFSISSILNYLQYSLSHFPVSDQQARSLKFILLYLGIFILIQTLKPFFKLVIEPEKIYYSFLKNSVGNIDQAKKCGILPIDYSAYYTKQMGIITATPYFRQSPDRE